MQVTMDTASLLITLPSYYCTAVIILQHHLLHKMLQNVFHK